MSKDSITPSSSQITLGLWPLSGVTTKGVSELDRDQTMQAAIQCGIRSFDSAFSYGITGEADRLIKNYLAATRDDFLIHSKVGQRYENGVRIVRCDPDTLHRDAAESLTRCGIDRFDTLLLHGVDPKVPVEKSATAMLTLLEKGLAVRVGLCNATIDQMQRFANYCPLSATQCSLNLLQRGSLDSFIPWCVDRSIRVDVFWTLMKGLLAGRIRRGHQFADGDSRLGYDIFQGEAFERAQRLVERLEVIADEIETSISAVSIGWAMSQSGVDHVLIGARKPEQVREISQAKSFSATILERIDS